MLYNVHKRYALIFKRWIIEYSKYWNATIKFLNASIEEFDTLEEVNEVAHMYDEIYGNAPTPKCIKGYWYDEKRNVKYSEDEYKNYKRYTISEQLKHILEHYTFDDDAYFYGYVIIDYEKEKIMSIVGNKFYPFDRKQVNKDLELKDILFRKDDEIPKGYKFASGEYEGWLQFRWGNGLNAIEIEDKKNTYNTK